MARGSMKLRKVIRGIVRAFPRMGCCRATPWGVYGPEKFSEYIREHIKEKEK